MVVARIPSTMWLRNHSNNNEWFQQVQQAKEAKCMTVDELLDNDAELGFNFEKVGKRRNPNNYQDDLTLTSSIARGIFYLAKDEETDERLNITTMGEVLGDGMTRSMQVDLKMPDWDNEKLSDNVLSGLVAMAMRRTARQLKYGVVDKRSYVDSMVYGSVRRERGITLETNPVGSCSLDTDGSEFESSDERLNLYGHNLYSHEQQLICFTGAVALAYADKLVR